MKIVYAVRSRVGERSEGVRQHVHVAACGDEEPESGGSKQRLDELARPPRAQWRWKLVRALYSPSNRLMLANDAAWAAV